MTVLLIIDDCTSHCSNVINFKQRAIEYVIGIKKKQLMKIIYVMILKCGCCCVV